MGLTSENFNLSGNIPVDNILLVMYVRGDTKHGALIFNNLVDISSYPWESLIFMEWTILSVTWVVAFFNLILEFGQLKFFLKYYNGSI